MPELTVEEQLARYGRAVEDRATDSDVVHLAEAEPSSDRRWFPAAAALIAVLGLAAGVIALVDRGPETSEQVVTDTVGTGGWTTHVDPVLGWQVDVPPGWRVIEFEESCWQGFAVVNHDAAIDTPDPTLGCSTAVDRFAPFYSPHAAIVVYRFTGSHPANFFPPDPPDTEFPLTLSAAAESRAFLLPSDGVHVAADGDWTYQHVRPQVGPGVSTEDRAAAEAVIASLVPPWLLTPRDGEESEPEPLPEEPFPAPGEAPDWTARLDADDRLVVSFVGGPAPSDPIEACQTRYRADVTETDHEVAIRVLLADREPGVCPDEGYNRTVEVDLDAPLGERTVRDGSGNEVDVYTRALLEPSWFPGEWTWTRLAEGSSRTRHSGWYMTYVPAEHAPPDGCPPLSFTVGQGPLDAVGPPASRGDVEDVTVRGLDAQLSSVGPMPVSPPSRHLWWVEEPDLAVHVVLAPACGPEVSDEDLLRIAEGLE